MKKLSIILVSLLMVIGAVSCQKEVVVRYDKPTVVNPNPPAPPTVYEYGLKDLASKVGLKIGTAFTRSEYFANDSVKVLLARDFESATFGNEMKHDAIVSGSGKLNFSTADEMSNWAAQCGVQVFGHNLGWHSQQQLTYLNGLVSKSDDENKESLLQDNWRFENGEIAPFSGTVEVVSSPRETFAGEYSVKAPSDGATLVTPPVNSDAEAYALSFWANGSGDIDIATSDGKTATVSLEEGWNKYTVSEKIKDGKDYSYTLTLPEGTVIDNIHIKPTEIGGDDPGKVNYINPYTVFEGGDFEDYPTGTLANANKGWATWNGGDLLTVSEELPHSGNKALKVDNSAGGTGSWDLQPITPACEVTPGKTYRIAWYGRCTLPVFDMQIDIREDGSTVGYYSSEWGHYAKMNDSEWTYQYMDYTVASGSELQVAFYCGSTDGNIIYIDDFQVFDATLEGDFTNYIDKNNLLGGADFEGAYDWGVWNGPDYASIVHRNYIKNADGQDVLSVDANKDKVHSALHALVVDNSAGQWSGGDGWHIQVANNNVIDVTAGKEYRIGFWAKSPDGYSTIQVEAKWDSGTDYIQVPGITDQWSFISIDKVAPEGASTLQIVLDCAYSVGTVYVDDFQVYPKPQESWIDPASIVSGGDFEGYPAGTLANADQGWATWNGGDLLTITEELSHSGKKSLKIDNSAGGSGAWDLQPITPAYEVTPGKTYRIAWYGRSTMPVYDMQIDIREDGSAVGYYNSAWGNYAQMNDSDWTYQYMDYTVASGSELQVAFYCGGDDENIIFIDDFQIIPLDKMAAAKAAKRGYGKYASYKYVRPAANSGRMLAATVETNSKLDGEPVADCMDRAYKDYVYGMIAHFDLYGWDVMNETFTDQGNWRNADNTQGDNVFIWGTYFGGQKNFVDKAFTYAQDALDAYGKESDLYINDYNLETSPAKLKAICDYATGNPNVTGIGTQMHLTANEEKIESQKAAITNMLQTMVETGKLVRISELDIVIESGGTAGLQADMYVYVFDQYLKIVPQAQRGGITIWGINDKDSWRGESNAPLLWSGKKYDKKPAYEALYLYLKEAAGM